MELKDSSFMAELNLVLMYITINELRWIGVFCLDPLLSINLQ
jgi:hypothetical protein